MKRIAILAILIISLSTVFPAYADDAKPAQTAQERIDTLNAEFLGLQTQLKTLQDNAMTYDATDLGKRIQAKTKRIAELQAEAKPLLEQLGQSKPAERDGKKEAPKKK